MSFKPNKNLLKILENKFSKSLDKGGRILEDKVKNNAPKKTGKLKSSIKLEEVKKGEIKITAKTDYAASVEFGTSKKAANPFMRSALKESKSKILKQFKGIL